MCKIESTKLNKYQTKCLILRPSIQIDVYMLLWQTLTHDCTTCSQWMLYGVLWLKNVLVRFGCVWLLLILVVFTLVFVPRSAVVYIVGGYVLWHFLTQTDFIWGLFPFPLLSRSWYIKRLQIDTILYNA